MSLRLLLRYHAFAQQELNMAVIARALEHGTERDVAWVRGLLGDDAVRDVLRSDARLSRRSANFWALCFGVPRDRVAALAPTSGREADGVRRGR